MGIAVHKMHLYCIRFFIAYAQKVQLKQNVIKCRLLYFTVQFFYHYYIQV